MCLEVVKLGQTVKKYRKTKKLSTQELASRLGVSTGFINHMENGINDTFKLKLLKNLIETLDIPFEEIINVSSPIITTSQNKDLVISIPKEVLEATTILNNDLLNTINEYIEVISLANKNKDLINIINIHINSYLKTIKKLI
ncbi:MAG: helix-turn-helix domain-containing protein [Clostridiaceae bacterium]